MNPSLEMQSGSNAVSPSDPNRQKSPLPGDRVTNHAEWRDLARQIQQEPDLSKMTALVEQLIAKFDESELQKKGRPLPQDKPDTAAC